jgi:hypothetical protein
MTTEDEIYEAAKRIGLFKLSNATLAADVEREMAEMSREAERLAAKNGTSFIDEYIELYWLQREREKREDGC